VYLGGERLLFKKAKDKSSTGRCGEPCQTFFEPSGGGVLPGGMFGSARAAGIFQRKNRWVEGEERG